MNNKFVNVIEVLEKEIDSFRFKRENSIANIKRLERDYPKQKKWIAKYHTGINLMNNRIEEFELCIRYLKKEIE